ncbi:SDR family NAD(P)-dependent oxidoreductase [Azospirillum thermophilum]|uniref:Ketoreductase domain-containing protein n=1 Tax=Azospirillum thermophilum TaxID=2202148 RepID=A0A2S2D0R9_9PROT|nr:SDR family oxidoreductase [Azospirillum thermophilum]AWK90240.1 hypothetical protein DEW08_29960 [Azospirillum thermophilum]
MDLHLADKAVLVTGASRGIGLAVARTFLKEGARVVLTARGTEGLATAQAVLESEIPGARIATIAADMTDAEAIDRVVRQAEDAQGPLEAVVANVGSGTSRAGVVLDRSDWTRGLDANLVGAMLLASRVLPGMTARGSGSLTFIASIAGVEAINAPVIYSAAKAGLAMAAKTLARQVARQGVRVNAVAPGNVLAPGGSWERKMAERPEWCAQYIDAEVPLGRFARAEEIADMVVFLASARASFMTGSMVVVDGGQTRSL